MVNWSPNLQTAVSDLVRYFLLVSHLPLLLDVHHLSLDIKMLVLLGSRIF